MIELTVGRIAEIVQGTIVSHDLDASDVLISGLPDTDSRLIEPGGIFFAKPGEFSDGFNFISDAIANGAAVVISERKTQAEVPIIVVNDVVSALGALATEVVAQVRKQGNLTVIAITGSNGKTTTKNLLAGICALNDETVAPKASFNNEVGAPLTMLKTTYDTRFLVLEMGASGKGHIASLAKMAPPDISVVLMVGLAHAGEFGGIEQTVAAKRELVEALSESGIAVLNADDERVKNMAHSTAGSVVTFGHAPDATYRIQNVETTIRGTTFEITTPQGTFPVTFPVLGEHHAMNAAASLAVCGQLGLNIQQAIDYIATVSVAERWRMEMMGSEDVRIINDAYNASPDSMAAALKTLRSISSSGHRSIAVLGEMAELGEYSGDEQDRLALLVVRLGIDQLVVVGDAARRLHISAINEGSWDGESKFFSEPDEAYDYLAGELRAGDIVLVKSSNSAKLRFLGDRLGEAFS